MKSLATLFLALALLLVATATPAMALDYPCPSDPGFCYLDVANDGCFDAGSDTGPIDALLEAGAYAPGSGSIICPPSVAKLNLLTGGDWTTQAGSRIELYAAKIDVHGRRLDMNSGDAVLLGGPIKSYNRVTVVAVGDIVVEGKLTGFAADLTSADGDILCLPGARFRTHLSATTVGGGNVVLDQVRVKGIADISATGDVILRSVQVKTMQTIAIEGQNILSEGKLALKTSQTFSSIGLDATAEIRVERAAINSGGTLRMSGADVLLGLPGANGKLKRSSLRAGVWAPGLGPEINATGDVVLEQVTIKSPREFEIHTTGSTVTLRDSVVKNGGSSPGLSTVVATPGSTCDFSGTKFINNALSASCGTVVGP